MKGVVVLKEMVDFGNIERDVSIQHLESNLKSRMELSLVEGELQLTLVASWEVFGDTDRLVLYVTNIPEHCLKISTQNGFVPERLRVEFTKGILAGVPLSIDEGLVILTGNDKFHLSSKQASDEHTLEINRINVRAETHKYKLGSNIIEVISIPYSPAMIIITNGDKVEKIKNPRFAEQIGHW
jgi:hypothetical protein